jgi:hypothetical protein
MERLFSRRQGNFPVTPRAGWPGRNLLYTVAMEKGGGTFRPLMLVLLRR